MANAEEGARDWQAAYVKPRLNEYSQWVRKLAEDNATGSRKRAAELATAPLVAMGYKRDASTSTRRTAPKSPSPRTAR